MLPYNGFSPQQRSVAGRIHAQAIAKGELVRPARCCICGVSKADVDTSKRPTIFLHLEDYRKPSEILPCCGSCHQALHIRFTKPACWLEKLARHGRQGSWFTLLSMETDSQKRAFDLTYPDGLPEPDWDFSHNSSASIALDSSSTELATTMAQGRRVATIVAAFARTPLNTSEEKIVLALLENPGATPSDLGAAIGSDSGGTWQLLFGKLCRRREADLWHAPTAPNRRTPTGKIARFYTGILADWDEKTHTFTMKSEAVEAFATLRITASAQGRDTR